MFLLMLSVLNKVTFNGLRYATDAATCIQMYVRENAKMSRRYSGNVEYDTGTLTPVKHCLLNSVHMIPCTVVESVARSLHIHVLTLFCSPTSINCT